MAEVRERRAVAERDERVDDRLRVHDHVDLLVGRAEEPVRLDHLEALVHQRRGVDRDLAAHRPGRVLRAPARRSRRPARRASGRGTGRPRRSTVSRSIVPGRSFSISWCSAECSESTGSSRAPVASRERHHELAADDERLLVGQRDVDALGERDDRGAEPGRADDRVEHEVGAGLGDQPHQALRARRAPRRPSTPPRRAPRRPRRPARSAARRAPRACAISASCERSAERPTSSNASGARATTSSACVPMEPVEPRIRSRFIRRPSLAGAVSAIPKSRAGRPARRARGGGPGRSRGSRSLPKIDVTWRSTARSETNIVSEIAGWSCPRPSARAPRARGR